MSEESKEFYYHHPFNDQMFDQDSYNYSFSTDDVLLHGSSDHNNNMLSAAGTASFDLSPVIEAVRSGGETPNSPMSSSSTEDNSNKLQGTNKTTEVGDQESTKKDGKGKKKGEKNEKQPRFAFLTKSEVDHLEDGYRWRKYGQKAVKNSPYPRSYYRCTTQKCPVKKRLERSFQDPSTVITTYEGQHNHLLPSTLRGNVALGMFAPAMMLSSTQPPPPPPPQDQLLLQMPHHLYTYGNGSGTSNNIMYHHHQQQQILTCQQYQVQYSDYGLLQDVIPSNSVFPKQEP